MLKGIDGRDAMDLWERYFLFHDKSALHKQLVYNKDDIINLFTLRKKTGKIINRHSLFNNFI